MRRLTTTLVLIWVCLSNGIAQDSTQWYLPVGVIARIGKGNITDIKYSPDGTLLAVGTSIGVWLYDARTRAEITLLAGHAQPVTSIAFSPDGKTLASVSFDDTVRLWDVRTHRLKTTLDTRGHIGLIAFSPDGATVAVGGWDLYLWDAHTFQLKTTIPRHDINVSRIIAFSPDGKTLASAASSTVWLWDAHTGQLRTTLTGNQDFISSIAFAPDGKTLACGDRENKVHLWALKTSTHKTVLTGSGSGTIESVVFSPDGATLASKGSQTIVLWDPKTGKQKTTLTQPGAAVTSVTFSPDGATLTSGGSDGIIRSWDTQTWQHKTKFMHTFRMHSIAFTPDGTTLAIGGDEEIWLWDVATRQFKATLRGHTAPVTFLSFSQTGATLTSKSFKEILLWDAQTGERSGTFMENTGHILAGSSNALSPDGTKFALGKWDGTTQLWSFSGELIATLTGHTEPVTAVTFSKDNSVLATGSYDGTIQLWDAATRQHKATLAPGQSWVEAVAFSPDSAVLASGHLRGVRLWNLKTDVSTLTLGHSRQGPPFVGSGGPWGGIASLVFLPDGETLVSGGSDNRIRLWDAATGHHQETLVGHVGRVTSLACGQSSPGSVATATSKETLASLSDDGTVLLWEIIPSVDTNAIVRITPSPTRSPAIGKQLSLNVDVSGGENVTGYRTVLEFDATTLRYISSQNGDYLPGEATFVSELVNPNRLRVIATASAAPGHPEGTLATVTFEVLTATASTVRLSHVRLMRSDGKGARPITVSGSVLELPQTTGVVTDYTQFALPAGATARIGKGTINVIKLSPDKTLLAVAGSAGVWLYDANTGAELALLNGHTAPVSSIAFSPYGDILASGSYDGKICLWNPQTRQLLRILSDGEGVASVTFSPNGKTVANASGTTIRLWDAHTGEPKASFGNQHSSLSSIIFSPNGETLASEDVNDNVQLWDAQTGVHKATIKSEDNYGSVATGPALAFSPDGTLLARSLGTTMQLLDAETGEKRATLEEPSDSILSMAFSADGTTLVSAGRYQTMRLWDTRTGAKIAKRVGFLLTPPVPRYRWQPHRLRLVEFLSDGELFATADSRRGVIRLADTNTGEVRLMLAGYTAPITSIAFSADGTSLAWTEEKDGLNTNIQLWDVQTGQHAATFMAKNPAFRHADFASFSSVSFSPDGETLAGGSSDDGRGFLWDVQTQQLKATLAGHESYQAIPIGFSPDGQTLASGSGSGAVRLWDVQTGNSKMTLWGHTTAVRSVAFSPDGELLASGGETIRLWDARTGAHRVTFVEDTEVGGYLTFSPDSATLASAGNTTVQLWDIATGKRKATLSPHFDQDFFPNHSRGLRALAVVFSPDGSTLATATVKSGSVQVWNAETGEYRRTLRGHTDSVTSLAFSPDGRTLASGSLDGTQLLWKMAPLPLTRIHITPRFVEAPPLGKRLLAFKIDIAEGRNVTGYQFTVNFDAAALRYISSRNDDYLPGEESAVQPVINQNSVTLAAHSATGASSGNGTLATVTFEVTARTASTLTLSDAILTDSDGNRSFPLTGRGWIGEPPPVPGDVNNDRQVDTQDLEVVASRLGQPGQGNRADVNGDGVIDIADLVWITRKIQSASSSTD